MQCNRRVARAAVGQRRSTIRLNHLPCALCWTAAAARGDRTLGCASGDANLSRRAVQPHAVALSRWRSSAGWLAHGKLAGTVDSRVPGCSIHAYHTAAAAHVGRQGRNQRIPLPYRMARPFKWVPPRCLINPLIKSKPPPPPPDPTLAPHSLGTRLICRPCCVRAGVLCMPMCVRSQSAQMHSTAPDRATQ